MSGFYQLSPSSMTDMGISPTASLPDMQEAHYQSHLPPQMGNPAAPLANHYQSLGYYPSFPDSSPFQEQKPPSGRSRKKSTSSGGDPVKHRRTRSGCYTCRGRRVKCDENRPICDRCRKGKRDCVYPDPPTAKGSSGSSSSNAGSRDAAASSTSQAGSPDSSDEPDEFDRESKLESIPDADEPIAESGLPPHPSIGLRRQHTVSSLNLRKTWNRHNSETPSLDGAKGSSPSMSSGTSSSFATTMQTSDTTPYAGTTNPEWAHLSKDVQYYLGYFCESMTHYSYGIPNDPDDFFRSILPSLAVREGNDALLYAVVGFAAYHASLRHPHGKIEDFLGYYNKSVTLLLSIIKRGEKQDLGTLLTILQLATIEEYLGDWVNLSGHQKAAMAIVTEIFTPQSIMESNVRELLTWYIRFDVFVALMGGFEPALPREWFTAAVHFSEKMREEHPEDLSWRVEVGATTLRLLSVDMSLLYAKGVRKELPPDIYAEEYSKLTGQLFRFKETLDPVITDPSYLVTDFEYQRPPTEDDVVNPYLPGCLYKPPLFATTILLIEWYSIIIMHISRQEGYGQHEPSDELRQLAMSACEMFETVRRWPHTPPGAIIAIQACLALACLFIPRDPRYHMWIRRRYASLEAAGYIAPLTLRQRLAELFREPTCEQWWLPNEEGLSPILREIRAFADGRNGRLVTHKTAALREMSAIFSKMHIRDDDTPT
ncbi:hypothetical protein F5Y17DRAFT_471031 [Xylariaceae sp. FL0594]|nr:hypothetical protein F5Y17DRAFT_471031 [Xylariaceae sp. FL0594]